MTKLELHILLVATFLGLTVGNLCFFGLVDGDYRTAIERTWFQGIALVVFYAGYLIRPAKS